MRARVYILLMLFVSVLPMQAQTRLTADKRMGNLGRSNSHFTLSENKRYIDLMGLRQSDYTGDHHSLGAYVYGGYASVASAAKEIQISPGGYKLQAGGLYEFRHGYFTLQTGAGFMYRNIKSDIGSYCYTNTSMAATWDPRWDVVADSWGMAISELRYDITSRRDELQQVYVQVPILMGINFYGIYALAGITPSLPLYQRASTSMNVSSRGSYSRYLGLGDGNYWEEMDNHGYRKDVPLSRSTLNLPSRLDLIFSLEAGYDFKIKDYTHLRLAAYADMSINRISGNTDKRSLYIPYESKWDFETFEATPVWYSDVANGKFTHHFSAGLKLTILYTFPKTDKCILCSQHYGRPPRRR